MAAETKPAIDEQALTKGQLRKLNALRKSVGPEIGERAFVEWMAKLPTAQGIAGDPVAERVAAHLWELVDKENLTLPRGGYLVRRGRGRVVVEPARSE